MKTPEGREKSKLDRYLAEIGAYTVKPTAFGHGRSGAADRICCIAGTFFSLEVKREGGKPTPLQCIHLRETQGALGRIAWGTADDIIAVIERWMKRKAFGGKVHEDETDPHAKVPDAMVPR